MSEEPSHGLCRRSLLRTLGGITLGTGLVSTRAVTADERETHDIHHEDHHRAAEVGYHSLGGVGSTDVGGHPTEPHYGGIRGLDVHRDRGLALVSIKSSRSPTPGRGVAVFDISAYTTASDPGDLEGAEPTLLSFLPNENGASAMVDVKFTDDGQYAHVAKQTHSPDAIDGGESEPRDDTSTTGTNGELAALYTIDLSDPENPTTVARYDGWAIPGPHHVAPLHIGGTDYAFVTKVAYGAPSGVYVFEFDRDIEALRLVNKWTEDGQLAQGRPDTDPREETAASNRNTYLRLAAEHDPTTGRPLGYVVEMNFSDAATSAGTPPDQIRVVDLSDPTDIELLGTFTMQDAFDAEPATVRDESGDLRRVFVAGQMRYASARHEGPTGRAYLVDADDLFAADFDGNLGTASDLVTDPTETRTELASWQLSSTGQLYEELESLHEFDVVERRSNPGKRPLVVAGHQNEGVRVLELTVGDTRADSAIEEVAYFRNHYHVPRESTWSNHLPAVPEYRIATTVNGVGVGLDIDTGIYFFTTPSLRVGRDPAVDVQFERTVGDGSVVSAGATVQITLQNVGDDAAYVRDRIPAHWTVIDGDSLTTRASGAGTLVEFNQPLSPGESATYFVDVGGQTGVFTAGAAAYSPDGHEWLTLGGTTNQFDIVPGASDEL